MKKFFIILLMLFTVISITLAQPAMIDKGNVDNLTQVDTLSACQEVRDDLHVEILATDDPYNIGGYHFPNDSSLLCPMGWMYFVTNYNDGTYWHTWETSLGPDEYVAFGPNDSFFCILLNSSCYIKVTVTDDDGNTGTDSIYFNIYDFTLPDDFEMEIVEVNNEFNAKISFTPGYDLWFFQAWLSQDSLNFVPYGEGWEHPGSEPLHPNDHFEYIFYNYDFNENSTWNIAARLYDSCGNNHANVLPGMYLSTESSNDNHFLKFKTSIQTGDHDEYVYTILTVDSNGIRYPFIVDDEQVILPSSTINYKLPILHEHPYYQCAVANVTDDGNYKILSYSNKVANPYNSTVNIGEYNEYGESNFQIYPNPARDGCNVKGIGRLIVTNILGQTILEKEINGQTTVALSPGLYFAIMNGTTRKIVVE